VIWGGKLQYPLPDLADYPHLFPRSVYSWTNGTYWINPIYSGSGEGFFACIVIPYIYVPKAGTIIQISFSVDYWSYEWGIVGRDAATIDSAGLSQVMWGLNYGYEYAGADMNSTTTANMMPYIMHPFTVPPSTRSCYMDSMGRTALRGYYCPTNVTGNYPWDEFQGYLADWENFLFPQYFLTGIENGEYAWLGDGTTSQATPIASSNIVVEGGYYANLAATYANDFTSANFNLMNGKITAWPCWSKNSYASNNTVGYAVLSTYLDENGTVMFLVWGYYGRDTYWASQWFAQYMDGYFSNAFYGVTSIVLQINYKASPSNPTASQTNPTFNVVECLGTISETLVYSLGGIHPDP